MLGTIALELAMFIAGLVLYLPRHARQGPHRHVGVWALIVFLLVIYASVILGPPPPPSVQTIAWMGLLTWLMPLWAWWADRHREARG